MSWWTWRGVHGTVIERVEGRLIDLSASGCRIETSHGLDVGSVGVIEVRDLATPIAEAARVCHTIERPGAAARYVLQLEFMPLALARRAPAAAAVCRREPGVEDQVLTCSGERSGSNPTSGVADAAAGRRHVVQSPHRHGESGLDSTITETAEALADRLNSGQPVTRERMVRDHRCQREPSAFSGTKRVRADD
jgi:hypothetical protein